MANKYKVEGDIYDLIEEEDRECDNNLKRAKTDYYTTLTSINIKILNVLNNMDDSEIKDILYTIPVKRIK